MGNVTQNQWTEQQTNHHGQHSKGKANRQEYSLSSIQQTHTLSFHTLVVLVVVFILVVAVVTVATIGFKPIAVISIGIIVLLNILTSSNPVITIVRSSFKILIRWPVGAGRRIVVVIIIMLPWVPTSAGTLLAVIIAAAAAAARGGSSAISTTIVPLSCIIYRIIRLCWIVIALDSVIACDGIVVDTSGTIIVGSIVLVVIIVVAASTGISVIAILVVGVIILTVTQPSLLTRFPSNVVGSASRKPRPYSDRT
jgi:hypothetical protein